MFDLDDTLYPELDYARSGIAAVAQHISSPEYSTADIERVMLDVLEEGVRHKVFDVALERLGIRVPIAPLVQVYRSHSPSIQLSAAARETLEIARDVGAVGLITDGFAEVQWSKIRALSLHSWIDHIVVTDELGRHSWKPSEDGFRRIMEMCPATQYCYVADNPEKDFQAPARLGWTTVRTSVANPMYVRNVVMDARFVVQELSNIWDVWP
ncbi:MAG: HAD family hydrolase [bacterium]